MSYKYKKFECICIYEILLETLQTHVQYDFLVITKINFKNLQMDVVSTMEHLPHSTLNRALT